MKKIILIFLLMSISLMANMYDIKPIQITKDVHCVIGDFKSPNKSNKGFVSNMCYIDMGVTIVVLDAGPTYNFAKEFYDVIKKDYPNKKISYVIISNYHDDRILGASYFQEMGAKIIGHKSIEKDIKNNPDIFKRLFVILDDKIMYKTKLVKIDVLANSGFTIKGRNKAIKIIKPSITSEENSDIAIYSKEDNFLFVGNIVFNGRMLNYTKNSKVDSWIEAIENLAKLDVKYLIGGHGKDFDKDSYKDTIEYLRILKHDVKKAYNNEVDREDVKINISKTGYQKKNIPYLKQLNRNNINNYYDQIEWADN